MVELAETEPWVSGDGRITKEELARGVRLYLGKELEQEELSALFSHFDSDNSGSITIDELLKDIAPKSTYELLTMSCTGEEEQAPIAGRTSAEALAARQPAMDAAGMEWPSARDLSLTWGHAMPRCESQRVAL